MDTLFLRCLALLVPSRKRREWLREWNAERYSESPLWTLIAAAEDALQLRFQQHKPKRPPSIDTSIQDLRFAALSLWRAPGFSLVVLLTLALTIGANAAVLSVADAVLLRPLPYAEPDSVFVLGAKNRRTGSLHASIPTVYAQALENGLRGLSPLAKLGPGPSLIVPGEQGAERVRSVAVSANYFGLLGVTATRGRTFVQEDAVQSIRAAMLSYSAWQLRFGADEEVVGRSIAIADESFDIVGVLPAGFVFPHAAARGAELVTVLDPRYSAPWVNAVARLEPNVTRAEAQAEIDATAATIVDTQSDEERVPILRDPRTILYPVGMPIMALLLVAAALVLLVGCANLANLMLARTRRRRHETGVRVALGACKTRLVRPLLFEAMILGTCGAALAVLIVWLGFDLLAQQIPTRAYVGAPIGVDLRVASLTFLLGFGASLIFAAVPTWKAARTEPYALIRGRPARASRESQHLGRPMIVAQVALSVVVVFGSMVAGRAFIAVLQVPSGVAPDNVITAWAAIPSEDEATADRRKRWEFFTKAVAALAERPEVVSASAVGKLPLDGTVANGVVRLPGTRSKEGELGGLIYALPGYWETVGIRLLRGRLPNWDDVDGGYASPTVLSESAAQSWFGRRDALGATLESHTGQRLTVVGIVDDVISRGLLESGSVEPVAYVLPSRNESIRVTYLVVRVRSRGDRVLAAIRAAIVALTSDPDRTVVSAGWWRDSLNDATPYRNPRFQALVLGGFGALALAVTGLGIFSVVAFLVVLRTREIGIRGALGATPGSLMATMVQHAIVPAGFGLLIGLAATRGIARLVEAQLYDVDTHDPAVYGATSLAVIAMALLAVWIPARRASRIDPVVTMRAE